MKKIKKSTVIFIAGIAVLLIGTYLVLNMSRNNSEVVQNQPAPEAPKAQENKPQENNATSTSQASAPVVEAPAKAPENKAQTVIGKSVDGRDIIAYHFGSGAKEILFVGGIHGGYAWNTALLMYQEMDYLKANPNSIPGSIKVTIIPAANPDGLSKVVNIAGPFKKTDVSASQTAMVAGRFNAHNVDLNRNFDCNWKASGVWQNKTVSGGTAAFSEPESAAVRDYSLAHKPAAVVAWHSAAGGVYSSSCGNGILPETQTITDIYAKASGYPAYKNFESYQVSGDMTDWFAKNSIPAINVLLTTHEDVELNKNLAGIKALFDHYSK